MNNPLIKRIPRELTGDWRKYLVIIVFMVVMIGVISGMYVGHDSMLAAIEDGKRDLKLEDGSFELKSEASTELLETLTKGEESGIPVTIYEHFYVEEAEDNDFDGEKDATIRIFKSSSPIDKASFNYGRAPENASEIAIDRMHADNAGIKIGDKIKVGDKEYEVVGLLSFINYLTLHESNTDLMFDAFGFDVAMVTDEAFEALESRLHYSYAYFYNEKPGTKSEKAEYGKKLLEGLMKESYKSGNELVDYLPEYLRQASNFAASDIDGDSTGTAIFCYILIAVIAFIFAITISNTIDKEATVIGTLRASGYSKAELIMHYMSMPVIVTLIGALIGNIMGYTVFKNMAVNLYYNSYSLPKCHTVLSKSALIKTTFIPLILMIVVNLVVIIRKMQLSPLKFLRQELTKSKNRKARKLPSWSFLRRFRLRILFQNLPNYIVLIFGVILVELMLCFAFGLPDSLVYYGEKAGDMMFADYQYMLMSSRNSDGTPVTTAEKTAERFSFCNLMYPKNLSIVYEGMGSGGDEGVTVYGISENSIYVNVPSDLKEGEVYISGAFKKKFGLKVGDKIELSEEYGDKSYSFTVRGFVDYDGAIAAFMSNDLFNKVFEKEEGEFSGFFSDAEITDLEKQNIATVVTSEDIKKVTVQLMHSVGRFIEIFKYVLVVLAAALIYLLAKIIIEKNEQSISMIKILGFENKEIGLLYILPTALVIIVITLISFVAGYYLMVWVFDLFVMQMDGYMPFYMKHVSMVLSIVYLLLSYAFVSVLDFIRIKKIPMEAALKSMD